MRKALTFRVFDLRVLPATALLLMAQAGLVAQVTETPQRPVAAPSPAPRVQADPQKPTGNAVPVKKVPDYPDRRTITLGINYWATNIGDGPDMRGGSKSTDYATIYGMGKPKMSPGAEIIIPLARTNSLHVEYFRTQGTGNQTLTRDSDLFLNQFYKGDYLASKYRIQSGKMYLDDLLWPHKFPVSRFRVKSLIELQYFTIVSSILAPLSTRKDAGGNPVSINGQGTRTFFMPTFGLAAEYALAPHVLFRLEGSGFGLRHKAALWDGAANISWRRKSLELVAGGKLYHFKTTPANTEYLSSTLNGAFVGLRFHIF